MGKYFWNTLSSDLRCKPQARKSNRQARGSQLKVPKKTGTFSRKRSPGSGSQYTYNAWADAFGFAHAVVNYIRPAYVPANDNVKVSFDVYADGKLVDTVNNVAMGAGVDRYTYGGALGSGAAVPTDAKITVENVKFAPTAINVQYKVNGTVLTAAQVTANLGAGATTTVDTTNGGGTGTVTFTPASSAYQGTYDYSITGTSTPSSCCMALLVRPIFMPTIFSPASTLRAMLRSCTI